MHAHFIHALSAAVAAGALFSSGSVGAGAAGAASTQGPPGGPVPAGFTAQSVTFVSAREGWVLGTAPCVKKPCTSVLRTLDGGRAWRGIPAPVAPLGNGVAGQGVSRLRFADPRDGFAYGPDLYVTHNGGSTWQRVRLPGAVGDLEAAHGAVYAAVSGTKGREMTYRSPAASSHWSRVPGLPAAPAGSPPALGAITLHGSAAWILIGGRLYATQAGARWAREPVQCPKGYAPALAAYDTRRLTMVCTSPDQGMSWAAKVVYSSGNGGATFTKVSTTETPGYRGNYAAQPQPRRVFLANSGVGDMIWASSNGGRTWAISLNLGGAGNGQWYDFGFTTATQGVAVHVTTVPGTSRIVPGDLYMTRNSGHSWFRVLF